MKNFKKNAFFLLGITLVVLYFVLKDDFSNIVKNLLSINLWWLLVAIICFALYIVFKTLAFYMVVKQEKKEFTFSHSITHNMITQFFNGITPFSTGGQPMEIYMLKQHGIRISKGTNIILQTFIFYQTALVLYGIIAVGLNYYFDIFAKVPVLRRLILIGFLINTLVVIALFIVAFSKRLNYFLLKNIINFLYKIKIVKNKEKAMDKWTDRLEEFHECARNLKAHKMLFLKGVLYNFISLTFYYIIPLFLAYSMGMYHQLTIMTAIVSSAYILIIGSFVPIPGASGGIEYGFMAFLGNFISGSTLPALLLIWRFITYYLPMIVGAIQFSLDKGGNIK